MTSPVHGPDEPLVLVDDEGPVWSIAINRPRLRNALGLNERRALVDALRRADGCDDCRVVVLTGVGPVFCAGGDIAAMPSDPAAVAARMAVLDELIALIVRNAKPVVAAVEGGAYGLGLSLAAACDTVVAANDARFVAAFGRLGLAADTGLHWNLAQRVGPARAKELILYATELSASQAQSIGLVSIVVAPGEAIAAARAKAQALVAASPPMITLTKKIFAQQRFDLDSVLVAEKEAQTRLLATPEFERRREEFYASRGRPILDSERPPRRE